MYSLLVWNPVLLFLASSPAWKSKQNRNSFLRWTVLAHPINKQHEHKQFEILILLFILFAKWKQEKEDQVLGAVLLYDLPLQSLGHIRPAVLASARVCLGTGYFLRPQGGVLQAFTPFEGGCIYCLAPEALLIRGMLTRLKVFLAIPDACGLQPCDQTHLNKALCQIWTDDKYREDQVLALD